MKNITIAVVGLGYVGLPLAVEFGKKYRTIGYDVSQEKIAAYSAYVDPMGEVSGEDLKSAAMFEPTVDATKLCEANFIIVAVPTPVDDANKPDFQPLVRASLAVAKYMSFGTTIIYESTVYPGATEEICLPILEKESGFKWGDGFFLGYSPERINPGDKVHTLTKIVKVVSGDSDETLERVADIYSSIITAGVFKASSIKVAEAAKVIENTQRDLNIAFVNELAFIFHKMGIETSDVLAAAGTKWNFLPFKPGLVGGHCIGVDPYYLTHKAAKLGYHSKVILAGRRTNDGMAKFVGEQTIKELIKLGFAIKGADVIVMGITFKENCRDLRNSKVIELIDELISYGVNIHVFDPIVNTKVAQKEYGLDMVEWHSLPSACAIVAATPHKEIVDITIEAISSKLVKGGLYVDVKSTMNKTQLESRGFKVWRL